MKYLASIILSFLISLNLPSYALAQNSFTLGLTLDENPEICSAYKAAWEVVYNSAKKIDDSAVDLKAAFPDATHISPTADNVNAGLAQRSHIAFDYDNDGDEEIIYFESKEPRGLYWATGFYFYNSLEDFESEPAENPQFGRFNNWGVGPKAFKNPKNSKAKLLAMYKDIKVANLFQIDGNLYSQSSVLGVSRRPYRLNGTGGSPRTVTLDWLKPDFSPTPICKIDFARTSISKHSETLNLDRTIRPDMVILKPLDEMYGGRLNSICYGTLGYSAVPISAHLPALFKRPQTIRDANQDTEREFRFIAWGLSDPSSFEVIRELKAGYQKFITDFTAYYQTYFNMDEERAKSTAERGYRYLLDKVVYGRSTLDSFHRLDYDGLTVGPATSLEDIATLAVENAIDKKHDSRLILKLGIVGGVDADKLKTLSDNIIAYKPAYGNRKQRASKILNENNLANDEDKQRIINELFLASLTHPKMRQYFLDLGANVDFPTNYFGKTALMYAAQNNDLDAVITLLKGGASPNSKTEMNPLPREYCMPPLKRDARTPLMYAAENADATLILTLVEAGANPSAEDTKGNRPIWYLNKNSLLSEAQKTHLQKRFIAK